MKVFSGHFVKVRWQLSSLAGLAPLLQGGLCAGTGQCSCLITDWVIWTFFLAAPGHMATCSPMQMIDISLNSFLRGYMAGLLVAAHAWLLELGYFAESKLFLWWLCRCHGKSVTNTVSVSLCPAAGSTPLLTLACLLHFSNRIYLFSPFLTFSIWKLLCQNNNINRTQGL